MTLVQIDLNWFSNVSVSLLNQLFNRVTLPRGEDEIGWFVAKHEPHTQYIVPCMAPVSNGVEIAEAKAFSASD